MTLGEVYALIPAIECKGLCAKSCGPIMCEPAEAKRLGVPFRVVEGQHDAVALVSFDRKMRCALLRNGRCTAYERRPAICRLWGVVETMPCLWGCVPERMLTDAEGKEILALAREAARSAS